MDRQTTAERPLAPVATAARTQAVRRAASRFCRQMGWAPLHEVSLPNGRRADILALRNDGQIICIEVKSCAQDFLSDSKWPEYREFSDALYFAVDADFPLELIPHEVGLIVTAERDFDLRRAAPVHPMAAARRRALLQRFARLAAARLEQQADPMDSFLTSVE